jgi:hypothetical protein
LWKQYPKSNIQRVELDEKIIEQVSEYKYPGNIIFFGNKDIEFKVQTCNKVNGIIRQTFGKQMSRESQPRLHNITSKAALTRGSENWILRQRKQRLEAAQMKFV